MGERSRVTGVNCIGHKETGDRAQEYGGSHDHNSAIDAEQVLRQAKSRSAKPTPNRRPHPPQLLPPAIRRPSHGSKDHFCRLPPRFPSFLNLALCGYIPLRSTPEVTSAQICIADSLLCSSLRS